MNIVLHILNDYSPPVFNDVDFNFYDADQIEVKFTVKRDGIQVFERDLLTVNFLRELERTFKKDSQILSFDYTAQNTTFTREVERSFEKQSIVRTFLWEA